MVDDTATDERTIPSILPQPTIVGAKPYHYVRYEQVEQAFFPNSLKPQTLCWVLLSKGKNKPAQMTERARVLSSECGEGNRVKVQYPLGSTYHVRRPRLIPVLEENERIIIVASETPEYRRAAVVHTTKNDNFIEIGCDYGLTVDSVDAKSTLGVDKSEESIDIARKRYPDHAFLLGDVFEDLTLTPQHPLVVAIDINGTRELPAVMKCVQLVLDSWSPRLVIVKSREFYSKLVKENP